MYVISEVGETVVLFLLLKVKNLFAGQIENGICLLSHICGSIENGSMSQKTFFKPFVYMKLL